MSSSRSGFEAAFEPDPLYGDLGFRPALLGGRDAGGFVRSDDGRGTSLSRAERGARETVPVCTEAEHAELEAAAFEKGRASAEADWARCEQVCAVLEAASSELARVSLRMLHASREQMLALAAEVARFWIGEELRLDPSRFAGPLERAVEECAGEAEATLRLHPSVLAALETSLPEQLARWSESLALELVADSALAPDAFRIESGARTIESDLDRLGTRLREALREAFESTAEEGSACR